jgi:hypothetical protein
MWEASNMKISRNKNIVPTDKSGQRMKHDFIRWLPRRDFYPLGKLFSFFLFIGLSFCFSGLRFLRNQAGGNLPRRYVQPVPDGDFGSKICCGNHHGIGKVYKFDDLAAWNVTKKKLPISKLLPRL